MTNHPNRRAVYKVQHLNGKFCHVYTKREALRVAREQAGADNEVSQDDLDTQWGVKLIRLTPAQAAAVGM